MNLLNIVPALLGGGSSLLKGKDKLGVAAGLLDDVSGIMKPTGSEVQLKELDAEIASIQHSTKVSQGSKSFILKVCGWALAAHYFVYPWAIGVAHKYFDVTIVDIDASELLTLIFGIGVAGGIRAYEKKNGLN